MARPTTQASLEKLGFEVTHLVQGDGEVMGFQLSGTWHAKVLYNGQRAAFTAGSAKELLDVAKGWVEHVSSTSD